MKCLLWFVQTSVECTCMIFSPFHANCLWLQHFLGNALAKFTLRALNKALGSCLNRLSHHITMIARWFRPAEKTSHSDLPGGFVWTAVGQERRAFTAGCGWRWLTRRRWRFFFFELQPLPFQDDSVFHQIDCLVKQLAQFSAFLAWWAEDRCIFHVCPVNLLC